MAPCFHDSCTLQKSNSCVYFPLLETGPWSSHGWEEKNGQTCGFIWWRKKTTVLSISSKSRNTSNIAFWNIFLHNMGRCFLRLRNPKWKQMLYKYFGKFLTWKPTRETQIRRIDYGIGINEILSIPISNWLPCLWKSLKKERTTVNL